MCEPQPTRSPSSVDSYYVNHTLQQQRLLRLAFGRKFFVFVNAAFTLTQTCTDININDYANERGLMGGHLFILDSLM